MRQQTSSQQRYDEARERRREKYRSGNGGTTATSSDRFRLTAFDAIKFSTAPTYLVKGIIPRVGLVVIWGPPKCGKSFWTFDLFMHVALGWPYRGRRVKQGPIVYLALEGGSGFAKRVEAWRQRHLAQDHDPVPFYLLDVPVDLIADHVALIAAIKAQLGEQVPAAVVIDTLNRALVGDENKSDDMARFIRAADAIRAAFGCVVPVVHHCGIQGTRPRGHTSLAGADDAQIAIERDDQGIITAKVEHMKDDEAGAVIVSRLERVELGVDDDGDAQASCIIMPAELPAGSASINARIRLTSGQRRFMDILRDAIIDAPDEHKTNSNIPGGRTATSREWVKICCKSKGWFDPGASDNNNRAKISNMLNALAGRQLVGLSNLYVWLAQ
jgi:hypothetical protein